MRNRLTTKNLVVFIPYIAVLVGLYLMGSIWAAIIGYHLAAAAVLFYNRGRLGEVKASRPSFSLVAVNAFIGLFAGALLFLLWPILGTTPDIGSWLYLLGLTSWAVFGAYYCAVNPIIEELLWRRYLETDSKFPDLNDFMFAGYHMLVLMLFIDWAWLVPAFALLVLASWIWGIAAKTRRGLVLITASHLLADVGIILAVYSRTIHF